MKTTEEKKKIPKDYMSTLNEERCPNCESNEAVFAKVEYAKPMKLFCLNCGHKWIK